MTTILKTKRGTITRMFSRELTSEERQRELADMEHREQQLAYDDRAARQQRLAAEDAAEYRAQRMSTEKRIMDAFDAEDEE